MNISEIVEELVRIGLNSEFDMQDIQPDVKYLLVEARKTLLENKISEFAETNINAVVDISWEQCNVGHWSTVPDTPKSTYSYASFLKVLLLLLKAQKLPDKKIVLLNEAIRAADLGLMLGIGYQHQLSRAATLITQLISRDKHCADKEVVAEKFSTNSPGKSSTNLKDEYFIEHLNGTPLSRVHCPSIEEFSSKYFDPCSPTILTGCIEHWPAMTKWNSLNYLVNVAGPRTVPIEIGSSYTQKDWGMELTTIQEFITKHITNNASKVGYLAQHQLFEQIPELRKDIMIPDYCCLSNNEDADCDVDINAWFGPANTVTPLHYDPKHNLFCQVVGAKRIILYSPDETKYVYPHDETMLNNTAKVDPYNPNFDEFPLFQQATAHYCILKPGEVLYIPPKWWHHVVSMDVSFSVSFWWE